MMSVRITLTLDEVVVRKLKEVSPSNISAFVNTHLKKCLLQKKQSMAGILAGRVSTKDIKEEADHDL